MKELMKFSELIEEDVFNDINPNYIEADPGINKYSDFYDVLDDLK